MPRSRSDYEEEDYPRSRRYGRRPEYDEYESNEKRRRHMEGMIPRHERALRAPHDQEGYAEDVGQGGWFGDHEGHSRAARKGWGEDVGGEYERSYSSSSRSRGRGGYEEYEEPRYRRSRRY